LKALAHADRLLLLCQLHEGEKCVNELGALAGLEQPSLSQQLAVLRRERLVATRRAGKQVVYRVASPAVAAVLQALYQAFCEPATAPQSALQRAGGKPGTARKGPT
jgi:ArsR family transcriptional regulator